MKTNFARNLLFIAFTCTGLISAHAAPEYMGDARSKGGNFGLGAMLGDPMAISAKYFFTPNTALNAAVGYGYSEDDGFQINLDYIVHPHVFTRNDDFSMSWFIGLGGAALLGNDSNANVRAPLGITFTFMEQPVEAFVEFAPGVGLVDDFGFAFDGGLGARFYF